MLQMSPFGVERPDVQHNGTGRMYLAKKPYCNRSKGGPLFLKKIRCVWLIFQQPVISINLDKLTSSAFKLLN